MFSDQIKPEGLFLYPFASTLSELSPYAGQGFDAPHEERTVIATTQIAARINVIRFMT